MKVLNYLLILFVFCFFIACSQDETIKYSFNFKNGFPCSGDCLVIEIDGDSVYLLEEEALCSKSRVKFEMLGVIKGSKSDLIKLKKQDKIGICEEDEIVGEISKDKKNIKIFDRYYTIKSNQKK